MVKNVTPRQRRAIEALLTCGDVKHAAQVAGVSRNTLYRWLKQEEFCAALQEAEGAALESLSRALIHLAEGAVATLGQALTAEHWGTRVRAADIVLSRLLQWREEVDLERRVRALEEFVQERGGRNGGIA